MMHANRGMTLLEVMLALVIFATAALGIQFAVSQHMRSLSQLEDKLFATLVADNQLALLTLAQAAPSSTVRGKAEMADREWYYTIESVRTAEGLLRAVDVTIYTDSERRQRIHSVRTYLGA
ncbi:type II secretion system minor pseudopilin GspI [Thaumasiovibrio sp. DFM-14]|uniref:type II secretion system minor pseudopilin GspI n=1 Tax=Thaumasiovibrio sp. DFM-14 TaxID=3384792 RepID=UPI0039A390F6